MNSVNIEINERIHYTDRKRWGADMKRAKTIGIWFLTALLLGVFLLAGGAKIMAAPEMVESFQAWGYPDWFRVLVGGFEIGASLLLLFPRTAAAGAVILCLIMVGACDTHLRWQEYKEAIIPLTIGTLCALLAIARRSPNGHYWQGWRNILGRHKSHCAT